MSTFHRSFAGIVLRIVCLLFLLLSGSLYSQSKTGAISGVVTDVTGALIPGAEITLTSPDGRQQLVTSDGLGHYNFSALAAGRYTISTTSPGFRPNKDLAVQVSGRAVTRNIQLEIAIVEQQVEVLAGSVLDTEPSNNASALTLKGSALQTISDDPDDLAQDLQLLAGPSAGPEGGEIYVDGFSGAKLPPKSAIREIRVNQNPFSAEYDRLGYGRVEILTRPGADNYHGELRFNFGDSSLNSRNPFAPEKPQYQRRMIEGTLGGPIGQKTSFTFQFERRDIGQAALINAMILDSGLNVIPYRESILDPRANTEISGRIDYQINKNHTLVGRYEWEKNLQSNAGLDTFSMASRAFNLDEREHVFQLIETAMLSSSAVNEIKFQYRRSQDANQAVSSDPSIQVLDAFTSGGSSMSLNGVLENRYELQELLSLSKGKHTLKMGGRFRAINENNASGENYNGLFTFNSLEAYRITQAGLAEGLSPEQIRSQGGGASQFTIAAGDPMARITQFDAGLFLQDDLKIGSSLTLSGGLRYENQTNIDDWRSWGPRLGIAWGIPGRNPNQPFAVLRAGFGVFYDRIREGLVLDSKRLDGVHQQEYQIPNPDFYPNIPAPETLSSFIRDQAIRRVASDIRAPSTQQLAFSLERQFPKNTTVSLSYMDTRGTDVLRSRNINAPMPQTGLRPLPGGNIYVYESSGRFRQQQFVANVNARINRSYNLFGNYTWGKARSDTDGAWTFPANPYDLKAEYSRAGFDVRHRAMIGGSLTAPLGLLFNPFVVMHSGSPFDVVIGQDLNGDSIFNDRPAWATDMTRRSVVQTRWGNFDTQPIAGQTIIPRNLGDSPGMVAFNLRLSKAFGFGKSTGEASDVGQGGAPFLGLGSGRGHYHGSDAVASDRRYSLTLSVSARNLLNIVNLGTPVGNLNSPLFGSSNSIHGFGPGAGSANRTIDLQMKFSF